MAAGEAPQPKEGEGTVPATPPTSAEPAAQPQRAAGGYGFSKWDAPAPQQKLSAYEQKMMKRLERAQRLAHVQATGKAPEPAPPKQEEAEAPQHEKLPPPPAQGADHERLLQITRNARKHGQTMFYFPGGGTQLKDDAVRLSEVMKEEEARNEDLRQRNQDNPERGMYDFMERLEDVQTELRRQRIEAGEVEDPWGRPDPSEPAVSSAGKPHEVVVDNGSDEEAEEKLGCSKAKAAAGPKPLGETGECQAVQTLAADALDAAALKPDAEALAADALDVAAPMTDDGAPENEKAVGPKIETEAPKADQQKAPSTEADAKKPKRRGPNSKMVGLA